MLPGERIGIAVADVSGKGIAAALLMSVVQASLRVISGDGDIPVVAARGQDEPLPLRVDGREQVRDLLLRAARRAHRRLRYVNAGHNPPYLVRRTDAASRSPSLSAGGTVLGLFDEVEYDEAQVDLRPGDLLVAFTDGVTEARQCRR